MSIQWTFIAGYLYAEIAIVLLLILPIFSPRRWHKFFQSRLFTTFKEHAAVYFYGLLGILGLFLFDSIKEMRKYSHSTDPGHVQLASEMKGNVKLFRSQRNFYITGFAIFLTFVIRRLITMILIQYELQCRAEQIIKKAENAVQLAKTNFNSLATNAQDNQSFEEIKDKLTETQMLLEEQKTIAKHHDEEAKKWKLMYEEVKNSAVGQGDAEVIEK